MNVDLLYRLVLGTVGLSVGSFLNICIDRLPRGQSLVTPPSHCPSCKHRLSALDLVPLFNYLWLHGRCRYCRAPIPIKLPLIELAVGALFVFLFSRFTGFQLGMYLVWASVFTVVFVIDVERQLVLDKVVYPATVLAFAFSFLPSGPGPLRALEGGAAGVVAMAIPFVLSRGGMGIGDIKLAGLLGLITGFPLIAGTLLLAVIAGGTVSALLLLTGLKKRGDAVPFAPFLVTSAAITLAWGHGIWVWYMNRV